MKVSKVIINEPAMGINGLIPDYKRKKNKNSLLKLKGLGKELRSEWDIINCENCKFKFNCPNKNINGKCNYYKNVCDDVPTIVRISESQAWAMQWAMYMYVSDWLENVGYSACSLNMFVDKTMQVIELWRKQGVVA